RPSPACTPRATCAPRRCGRWSPPCPTARCVRKGPRSSWRCRRARASSGIIYQLRKSTLRHVRTVHAMQETDMREKLVKIIQAYEDLQAKMGDPAVLADQKEYNRLAKEY